MIETFSEESVSFPGEEAFEQLLILRNHQTDTSIPSLANKELGRIF